MNCNNFTIFYLNTYGQTKFTTEKQKQIQDLFSFYQCDLIHLQETDINDSDFENCHFLRNNFNILVNNSMTKYGTCSLIKDNYACENVKA